MGVIASVAYATRGNPTYCHIEVSQETEISLLHCGFRDISLTLNMTKIDCHADFDKSARNDKESCHIELSQESEISLFSR